MIIYNLISVLHKMVMQHIKSINMQDIEYVFLRFCFNGLYRRHVFRTEVKKEAKLKRLPLLGEFHYFIAFINGFLTLSNNFFNTVFS